MKPVCSRVEVRVPATSANLGAGFDAVGLAFDHFDDLRFTVNPDSSDRGIKVDISGEGEDTLPKDSTNLVVSTFIRACNTFGLEPFGFNLSCENRIPQARGLGSSAEAIVAGISAAAAFSQRSELNRSAIFELAAGIEGHPDNVAPAIFGGLTVSWRFSTPEGVGSTPIPGGEPLHAGFHTITYPVDKQLGATLFVPNAELSTARARNVLPKSVPREDAIYNISRAALLPAALNPTVVGCGVEPNALLFAATQDRLHQSYRSKLMAPSWQLIHDLRSRGYAAAVSGAGPSVLVLYFGDEHDAVAAVAAERDDAQDWRVLKPGINRTGVQVSTD